ncbi:MAG: DUF4169 family protein [Rhodobiaceae bacterium]|nr:DUF4169 family protein [Rhodobiaceae bacterium]
MSAEIVNLRQARKKKARADKDARADKNRIAFGRTKAEKAATRAEIDRAKKAHDAGKRDPEGE